MIRKSSFMVFTLYLIFSTCLAENKIAGTFISFHQDSTITYNFRELQIDRNLICNYLVAKKDINANGDTLIDEGTGFLRYSGILVNTNGLYVAKLHLTQSAFVKITDSTLTLSFRLLQNDTLLTENRVRFLRLK
jgi:hypothetical protein